MIVEFSPAARGDLTSIVLEVSRHDPQAAARLAADIEAAAQSLLLHPDCGRRLEGVPDLRRIIVRKYLGIYRVRPPVLSILCIIHGARDIQSLLDSDEQFKPSDL